MKTIDERVDELMRRLPRAKSRVDTEKILQDALLKVAHDQRHKCAEIILCIPVNEFNRDIAYSAVMNANIEKGSE